MNQQTYDYISLKALSDRFREVAATITNDEIKSIIKSQISKVPAVGINKPFKC